MIWVVCVWKIVVMWELGFGVGLADIGAVRLVDVEVLAVTKLSEHWDWHGNGRYANFEALYAQSRERIEMEVHL